MAVDSHVATTSKGMYWGGWVLSVLPAPLLIMSGVMKIMQPKDVVEGFTKMGWDKNTATIAIVLAVLELGSLLLYLIPKTAVLGAILLTGYLGGAVATHVRVGEYPQSLIPVALGVLAWLGLWLRDARLRELAPLRR